MVKITQEEYKELEDYNEELFNENEELYKQIDELETEMQTMVEEQLEFAEQTKKNQELLDKIDLGYEVVVPETFDELYNACSINEYNMWEDKGVLKTIDSFNGRTMIHKHRYIRTYCMDMWRTYNNSIKITEDNFKEYKNQYVILRRVR